MEVPWKRIKSVLTGGVRGPKLSRSVDKIEKVPKTNISLCRRGLRKFLKGQFLTSQPQKLPISKQRSAMAGENVATYLVPLTGNSYLCFSSADGDKRIDFFRKREGTFLSLHPLQCSSCRVQEIQVNPKVDPYMEVAMAPKAAHHLAIVRSCNAINGVAIVPHRELQLHPLSAENSLLAKFFSPDQIKSSTWH